MKGEEEERKKHSFSLLFAIRSPFRFFHARPPPPVRAGQGAGRHGRDGARTRRRCAENWLRRKRWREMTRGKGRGGASNAATALEVENKKTHLFLDTPTNARLHRRCSRAGHPGCPPVPARARRSVFLCVYVLFATPQRRARERGKERKRQPSLQTFFKRLTVLKKMGKNQTNPK